MTKNGFAGFTNPFAETDFTKMFGEFKFPMMVNFEAYAAMQRKNLEALTQANQTALEGLQTILQRQLEIARQAVEELTQAANELITASSTEDKVSHQAELAKKSFEKAVANTRELLELATKSNQQAFDVISKRVTESVDELRDVVKAKPAASA